ncbi:MAG: DUF3108 domain-containing protein [Bacteroidales bacterium]
MGEITSTEEVLSQAAHRCVDKKKRAVRLFIVGLAAVFLLPFRLMAADPEIPFVPGETLCYDIYYHWGIIWKKAAQGTLHVKEANYKGEAAYKMKLSCKTLSFADKIMPVRDTLNSYTTRKLVPLYYDKIANEGNHKSKDCLEYHRKGEKTGGKVTLYRRNRPPHDTTLWVNGPAFDMLSVFYYLRMVDLHQFKMYQNINLPIFTGRKVITMNVKYMGRTLITLRNKKQYPAIRLNLSFLNDNNLKDEDPPIEVWLSDDSRKIPLKVEGKLPLGSLQAEYCGN